MIGVTHDRPPEAGKPREGTWDGGVAFEAAKAQVGLGKASPIAGALVIANTLVAGSGMLVMPHAVSVSGYVLGLGLIAFFCCASALGSHLLHVTARKLARAPCSFYTVALATVPKWAWLIDSAVAINCFGCATSYLVIVGDLLPDAVNAAGFQSFGRWHAVTVGFALAAPLGFLKDLSALSFTATASLLITCWTAVLILLHYAGEGFEPCGDIARVIGVDDIGLTYGGFGELPCHEARFDPFPADALRFGKALPVFVFAFTCQQNIFALCNETKDASEQRLDRVLQASYGLAVFMFAIVAFAAFATFGDLTNENVLKGYPATASVEITRVLFSLVAVFSYPLQAHPARASVLALLRMAEGAGATKVDDGSRFRAVTGCFLALSYLLAITVESLGMVLAVVGATASTMMAYILPGMVYLRTFPHPHFRRRLAYLQLGLGVVIMPLCLVLTFL